jgi:hypothetical protein
MKTFGWTMRGMGWVGSLLLAAATAQAAPDAAKYTVSSASGTVSVQGASARKSLSAGDELSKGETVVTAKSSTADITLDVGGTRISSIQVWELSTYTVGETSVQSAGNSDAVKATAKLESGSISGSFSAKSSDSSLKLEAGQAKVPTSAEVKPSTSFLVRGDGTVYCYNGQIAVNWGGKDIQLLTGQVFLPASGTVVPHNLPSPFAVVSTPFVQVVSPTQAGGR